LCLLLKDVGPRCNLIAGRSLPRRACQPPAVGRDLVSRRFVAGVPL